MALACLAAASAARAQAEDAAERAQSGHDRAPHGDSGEAREAMPAPNYSSYEQATIDRTLAELRAEIDPAPEGKIVEAIEVLRLEVVEDRDPAPNFVNWFHTTSKDHVIRREVLLEVGRPYRQALADETARNLRDLKQISVVLVLVVRGNRPGRVRVVVVTKDIWSLRLNSNYRIAGGALEYLFVQPSEINLAGVHHIVAGQMSLDPSSIALGAGYTMPRIAGSHVQLRAEANIIVERETGDPEGSFGSFAYGQPLYSIATEWAWGATLGWRREVTRRFTGGAVRGFDAEVTPEVDDIPYVYGSDILVGSYSVTRSFGRKTKHDVTLSAEASRRVYRVGDLSAFDPAAAAEFERAAVPVSDTRIGPSVEYHTYATRFVSLLDFNTLALQEDYRLGHDLSIELYPVLSALGSSRDLFGVEASLAYTVALGDGLTRASVKSITEIEQDRLPDASIDVSGRVHTPSFGVGRLVFDARMLHRYRNYLNRMSQFGGESRLRGYESGAFVGPSFFAANLELRSKPLEIWSVQLAGVGFFDVGDAFESLDEVRIKQAAGFGLRLLFPQLERVVMRADWGFPLTRGYVEPDGLPGDIVITFRQAFPMPGADE